MNFLAPLFLAGALAVALPVVFHLIRRTTRNRTVFSSLMFLKSTPQRLTRRNRLENILLLLLRCVAICLLATGFARPFVKHMLPETPSANPPKRIVILVDTSASMRRANLWAQACDRADAILKQTAAADRVAVFTFDLQIAPQVTFDEWNSASPEARAPLAHSRLLAAKPGWAATRLDQAIVRAAELLNEADKDDAIGPGRVVVISDFQEGSKVGALQGQEWPKDVELFSERVGVKSSNAALKLLADAHEGVSRPDVVRVRVSNAADSKKDQFQVGWAKSDGRFITNATDIYVPAGQSRIIALAAPGRNANADRIILRGDDEAFDNTVFHLPPETTRVRVLYLGNDSATNSHGQLYFLARALQGTARQSIEVLARTPDATVAPAESDTASMFVVSEAISETLASALRGQLKEGKTVLFAPTSAKAAETLGALLGQSTLSVEEAAPRNYAMLGEIDFRHPLFFPFADPRFSDFTTIHFWKYRRMDQGKIPNARVVAKFDNGDPAILDIPIGKGQVIVFTSGWQPADSQLALSTKFVPLLCSTLDLAGGPPADAAQFHVGDALLLDNAQTAGTINLPDGSSLKLAAGETNFNQTAIPGVYHVKTGTNEKRFAVNLDPMESRTTPLPLDELDRLGAPVAKAAVPNVTSLANNKLWAQSTEVESRQKLWRWFIAATLIVLLLETGIAGWTARKQSATREVVA